MPDPLLSPELADLARQQLAARPWHVTLPRPLADACRAGTIVAVITRLRRFGWLGMLLLLMLALAPYHTFRATLAPHLAGYALLAAVIVAAGGAVLAGVHSLRLCRHYVAWTTPLLALALAALLAATQLAPAPRLAQYLTYLVLLADFAVILCLGLPPAAAVLAGLGGLLLAAPLVAMAAPAPAWGLLLGLQLGAVACLGGEALLQERRRRLGFWQALLLRQQQAQLDAQRERIERLAHQDALTGLASRRHFDAGFAREWDRCRRERLPLAALLVDVDHFEAYNAHYGHAGGDDCLAAVGHALQAALLRAADSAARFGGEEFVVLLPHTEQTGAAEVAARILANVDALALPHPTSPVSAFVTVSIGYASLLPGPERQAPELLAAAGAALAAAKQAGRHRAMAASATTDLTAPG